MVLKNELAYWQKKRNYTLSQRELREIDYNTRAHLGILIYDGRLLSDISYKRLKKSYLYRIFDRLYKHIKTVDNFKSTP
jgi:hypothetical protein